MPRLSTKLPSCRLHKVFGQAVVTLNGKDVYLGPYHTDASRQVYGRIMAEWLANQRQYVPASGADPSIPSEMIIDELFLAYWPYVESYCRAITQGCDRAFPSPADLQPKIGPEGRKETQRRDTPCGRSLRRRVISMLF